MKRILVALAMVTTATLYGCGGGGGTSTPTVSGTASQGAAVAVGTTVTLTDARGAAVTGTVGSNGTFSIPVTNLTPPFVLTTANMYSYAAQAGATNINPLTNLAMQLAQGSATVSPTLPAGFAAHFADSTSALTTALVGMYPPSVTPTDFLTGKITIGGGVDKLFDTMTITPPDASGNYTVTISGHQVMSGTTSGASITAIPDIAAMTAASTAVFPISTSSTLPLGSWRLHLTVSSTTCPEQVTVGSKRSTDMDVSVDGNNNLTMQFTGKGGVSGFKSTPFTGTFSSNGTFSTTQIVGRDSYSTGYTAVFEGLVLGGGNTMYGTLSKGGNEFYTVPNTDPEVIIPGECSETDTFTADKL